MKKTTRTVVILYLLAMMLIVLAACGGNDLVDPTPSGQPNDSSASTDFMPTESTAPPLPAISIPGQNDIEITWTEDEFEPTVLYVDVSDYLRVRKGPSTEYDQVGALTRGTQVTVVARSGDWYRMEDGYYIHADFLAATPRN